MALTQRARDCKALRAAAPFSPLVLRYHDGLIAAWSRQANQVGDMASNDQTTRPQVVTRRQAARKKSCTFGAMLHALWDTSGTAAVPPSHKAGSVQSSAQKFVKPTASPTCARCASSQDVEERSSR
ncbi:hypothetical protein PTNB85_02997 [Pyrenophora teres f. teres]|nr:hypothetical protein HRS9139_03150 [Pyrenophora teres f. teres]KAE8844732.1 hypothetical protein PTNB85_02997 [Pyrenophora teres f. teres]KAE8847066.1 hypothetical protein HRS9122_03973 [Pyrenophora teres f. teres]